MPGVDWGTGACHVRGRAASISLHIVGVVAAAECRQTWPAAAAPPAARSAMHAFASAAARPPPAPVTPRTAALRAPRGSAALLLPDRPSRPPMPGTCGVRPAPASMRPLTVIPCRAGSAVFGQPRRAASATC